MCDVRVCYEHVLQETKCMLWLKTVETIAELKLFTVHLFVMFVTAVCILFLIKLGWPKKRKNLKTRFYLFKFYLKFLLMLYNVEHDYMHLSYAKVIPWFK